MFRNKKAKATRAVWRSSDIKKLTSSSSHSTNSTSSQHKLPRAQSIYLYTREEAFYRVISKGRQKLKRKMTDEEKLAAVILLGAIEYEIDFYRFSYLDIDFVYRRCALGERFIVRIHEDLLKFYAHTRLQYFELLHVSVDRWYSLEEDRQRVEEMERKWDERMDFLSCCTTKILTEEDYTALHRMRPEIYPSYEEIQDQRLAEEDCYLSTMDFDDPFEFSNDN